MKKGKGNCEKGSDGEGGVKSQLGFCGVARNVNFKSVFDCVDETCGRLSMLGWLIFAILHFALAWVLVIVPFPFVFLGGKSGSEAHGGFGLGNCDSCNLGEHITFSKMYGLVGISTNLSFLGRIIMYVTSFSFFSV